MINRVLQLNNSQLESSFNSLLEKHHVSNSPKPTQSKPNPICDRSGKLEDTERVFVDKGKTSRSQEIDDKRLHKELGSSDKTGKPVKTFASCMFTMEQENLRNQAQAHTQ